MWYSHRQKSMGRSGTTYQPSGSGSSRGCACLEGRGVVWCVACEVMNSGRLHFSIQDPIAVNPATHETDHGSLEGYCGRARPKPSAHDRMLHLLHPSAVNAIVWATAGYGFVHAMGPGHAFNLPGDEYTCWPYSPKSSDWSDFLTLMRSTAPMGTAPPTTI